MANEVRITVGADTKKADKAVKGFQDRLKDMSGKAKIAGAALSAMGVGGVMAMKGFAEAALVQKQAVDGLAAVVNNAGESFGDVEEKVMRVTAALQKKTNYGDEAQLRVLKQLVPMLGSTDKALEALPAVMEVAAATGKDFESTVATLGPVLAGMTNKVRGTALEFDKSQGPMERVAEIMKVLGGTAAATADPFTQMENAMGDVKESIGFALLPIITPLVKHLQTLAEKIQTVNPRFLKIAAVALAVATGVGLIGGPILLIIGLLPLLATGFAVLAGAMLPITAIVLGLTAAIAAGIFIYKNWGNITNWIGDRIENFRMKIQPLVDAISGLIKKIKELVRIIADSPIGGFLSGAAGVLGGAASAVGGLFSGGRMGFASGGMVPGPEGAPRMAVVHGGEMILNRSQQRSGGLSGITVNITGNHITGEVELDRIVRRAITSAGTRGAL